MKKYCRLTLLAVTLLAVSCQFDEILPETPSVESSIKIIGVISQPEETKLDFDFNSTPGEIVPSWSYDKDDSDKCDRVLGFDEDGGTFKLRVSSVNDDGEASFEVESGNISNLDKTYYAIYYPNEGAIINNKTLEVDLSEQNGNLDSGAPALMLATSVVKNNQIKFVFHNQTAIVGIKKIQIGDSEKGNLQNGKSVSKVSLSGIATSGTIEVKDGKLALTVNGNTGTVTASGSWMTDSGNGQIDFTDGGKTNPICFVVLPCENAYPVINATCDAGTFTNAVEIGVKSNIEVSNYYSISGKKLDVSTDAEASVTIDNKTTNYATLSQAIVAAYYSSEAPMIKLLKNVVHNNQITLSNVNGKPIVLDLNGKKLSTETESFITTEGTLTITDSGQKKGMITSSASKVLDLTTASATVTLDGCVIEGTKATGTSFNGDPLIDMSSASGTLNINDAKIYTTAKLSVLRAYNGTTTILNSELSSGTVSEGWYVIIGANTGTVNMSSGSLYTSGTDKSSTFHLSAAGATMTVADGCYLYSEGRVVSCYNKNYYNQVTLKGGFYNKVPSTPTDGTMYPTPSYGADLYMQAIDPVATYTHATIDKTLNYGYQVKAAPEKSVAIVNYKTFDDFAEAISAANSDEGDVTITLLKSLTHDASITLNNINSKEITLDLNGYTLTTEVESFITTDGELTIKSGTITSSQKDVISITSSKANVHITDCTITSTSTSGTSDRTIYHYKGKLNIDKAIITTPNRSIFSVYGTLTISNSTLTSSTYCLYVNGPSSGKGVEVTINSGSFYSVANNVIFINAAASTVNIKGGYYYIFGSTSVLYSSNAAASCFTIDGGYFNKELNKRIESSDGYSNVKELGQAETHDHDENHKGLIYSHGYDATVTSNQAASLGSAITGGITF